jgi:membrane protein implicated in regulation of membrane protease activity
MAVMLALLRAGENEKFASREQLMAQKKSRCTAPECIHDGIATQLPSIMQDWHYWTIAGILLIIVEMFTFSFFSASFGVAALITAFAAWNNAGLTAELTTFAISSAVCLALIRPLFTGIIYKWSDNRPMLTDAMMSQTGTVVDEIEPGGGYGRVKIGGEEWRAQAVDANGIPTGSRVQVAAVEGATLRVRLAGM